MPIEWLDCTVSGTEPEPPLSCQQPPRPDELIVRLLAALAADASEALGYSMIDVELRRGWLATIFVNRVDRLAAAARTDGGQLLGRAIAHELAHLLLGTSRHSARGLMRAHWRALDFAYGKLGLVAGERRRQAGGKRVPGAGERRGTGAGRVPARRAHA